MEDVKDFQKIMEMEDINFWIKEILYLKGYGICSSCSRRQKRSFKWRRNTVYLVRR
jgi:hypothetical protein